jgi:hypothetical protein
MNAFLKLPQGQLSAMARAQRTEELKKKLADPPAPLHQEVRELVIRKCRAGKQKQVREIFEKQAYGELERLVTQKLLDVTKKIAKDELENEAWLRSLAKLRHQSYEEMRTMSLEFLDTDVFNISGDDCTAFLDPMIESWDIDLKTFAMEVVPNRRLSSIRPITFQFVEVQAEEQVHAEPGFEEFLRLPDLSGDASELEIEFLNSLRFKQRRPTVLYFYRELQNLRDPLHFHEGLDIRLQRRHESSEVEKQTKVGSRKRAIRRWARHKTNSDNKNRK